MNFVHSGFIKKLRIYVYLNRLVLLEPIGLFIDGKLWSFGIDIFRKGFVHLLVQIAKESPDDHFVMIICQDLRDAGLVFHLFI